MSSPEHLSRWPPSPFQIPTFAFGVEVRLREGNTEFEKNGGPLQLTRAQIQYISENLSSLTYAFKAYPSDEEPAILAEALLTIHPCLKEAGSYTGWTSGLLFICCLRYNS